MVSIWPKPGLSKIAELFLISFITLFFEILFIRWIPSSIQIIAYFTNIVLISAFLGLGIGCLLPERKSNLMNFFPLVMLGYVSLAFMFHNVEINAAFLQTEHLLGFYEGKVNFLLAVIIVFIFNTVLFVPLGQKLGRCLKDFRPLVAYSINILGSILGIAAFSFLSYRMMDPVYWFLLGLSLTLWFYRSSVRLLALQVLISLMILLVVHPLGKGSYWSPYYKIDMKPIISERLQKVIGYEIAANNMFHQNAFNLSEKSIQESPGLSRYKDIYEFPYKLFDPQNVLILGAGSGNDASAALRMGSQDIYAVEIDPFIAGLGERLHQEKPYRSERVHVVIDDARSFIKRTNGKFDLITFGYLDAHKVLSQFSSVRLDNFIYTQESFRDIRDRLTPNGVLSLTYYVFKEWVASKLYVALKEVFKEDLRVFRTSTYVDNDTAIFLAGPGVKNITSIETPGFKAYDGFDKSARPIRDDWPYLYLTKRGIPSHYIIIIFFVLVLSVLSVFCFKSVSMKDFNAHFFFLGSGFMLLETTSITRFALLFGSTWIVNSAVIISILIMVLFATLYVEKSKNINAKWTYALLMASLFLNWLLNPEVFLAFDRHFAIIISSFLLSLPILFAGIIFAGSFRESKNVSSDFAYNLLGSIVGGCCEYFSMVTGFRFLFVLAMIMYYLSYKGLERRA
ncbi:MAG: class I SAM-dependent methyltransferase [Candidatus Omnitrophota bacterium]|jgi:SAM-dependent methyltransferase